MPTTTKSQSSACPSEVRTRSTAPVALEGLDAGAEQHPHAVVGVDVAVDRAQLGPQHALQRHRRRLDDGDLQAALARGRRDLGADPARADHDDRAAAVQPLAQDVRVLDAAQVEHAVQIGAGDREPPRLGAGGEQQPVVARAARRRRASPPARRCPGSSRSARAAARCPAPRRSPRRGRRPCRGRPRRAGSPWTAAAARTAAPARRRSAPAARRTPRRAGSPRPWRRRGSRRRSRTSHPWPWVLLGGGRCDQVNGITGSATRAPRTLRSVSEVPPARFLDAAAPSV